MMRHGTMDRQGRNAEKKSRSKLDYPSGRVGFEGWGGRESSLAFTFGLYFLVVWGTFSVVIGEIWLTCVSEALWVKL